MTHTTPQEKLEGDEIDSFKDDRFLKMEWDGRQTDWLLQWLVKFVNGTSLDIGVTLTVGGSFIHGDLISHDSYFELMSSNFSSAFSKFEGVDVEEFKETIKSMNAQPESKEGADLPPCQYLHLKNVKVSSGSGPLSFTGALWRGKISAVEGFNLGRPQ